MNNIFSNSYTDKKAQFLTGVDLFNLMNRFNTGLTLDGSRKKISLKRSLQHVLIVAPSGAGKTTSYIIPNILRLNQASAVVFDPSEEILNLCGEALSRNFDVKVFNVSNPQKSEFWNPLEKGVRSAEDIRMIADSIITSSYPNSQGSDKFWEDGAKSLINITKVSHV